MYPPQVISHVWDHLSHARVLKLEKLVSMRIYIYIYIYIYIFIYIYQHLGKLHRMTLNLCFFSTCSSSLSSFVWPNYLLIL